MALQNRFDQLKTDRDIYLMRARDCSKLTIPTMYPVDGSNKATYFPTPWQSMGARCVNNLASKLMLALFPPNAPFFKLSLDDFTLARLTQQKGMRAQIEEGLNKVERAVQMEIETTTSRPSLFEAIKQLVVSGNSLLVLDGDNHIRVHKLSHYVCKRDPAGNQLEVITKECISVMEVPDNVKHLVRAKADGKPKDATDTVDLYTAWCLQTHMAVPQWRTWQELDGNMVPGSQGFYPHDKCPARALRWTALDGEDYGRGMVEEYLGDFRSLEGLQKAIVQGAAAAAKVLFLVKPNSTTKKETVAKSESGDVHSGNAEDVTVLQMQKFNDFKVAMETRNEIITALSFAFMLNTAIQRNGERVTAEEIRYMAQELETGLGGVYSTMSQDLQLPLVNILLANMQRQARLPALPKGIVKPQVTTGIEAIGRGNDLSRIQGLIDDMAKLGPNGEALAYLNVGDFIKRAGTARQIDMDGLIKTEEQVTQERQQSMMAQAAMKAAPNAVNKIGDAVNQPSPGA
jgi:hypothetical protein